MKERENRGRNAYNINDFWLVNNKPWGRQERTNIRCFSQKINKTNYCCFLCLVLLFLVCETFLSASASSCCFFAHSIFFPFFVAFCPKRILVTGRIKCKIMWHTCWIWVCRLSKFMNTMTKNFPKWKLRHVCHGGVPSWPSRGYANAARLNSRLIRRFTGICVG